MTGRILAAILAVALAALAAAAEARETILDYGSLIRVHADSTLTVTETIRVRAEGRDIKRGIWRAFPTLYRDRFGNQVRVPFEVVEVLRDGRAEAYHLESAANGTVVYIGKSDVLIPRGEHSYTLTYRTGRQIGFFPDYDELYWNVTGSDWSFPRERIEAVVVLPSGAPIVQRAAYTGRTGERGTAFAIDRDYAGNIRFRSTRVLGPGEDMTIAVAWPKGYVAEPDSAARTADFLWDNASSFAALAGLLLVIAVNFTAWRRVGRDPERGTIIPLFKPPKGYSPAAVRYVLRMGFDDKALAAALVDMAVKGHLTIEAGRRITLRRKAEADGRLSAEERKLASHLFDSFRPSLRLEDKNHTILEAGRTAFRKELKAAYGRDLFTHNRLYLLPGLAATIVTFAAISLFAATPRDTAIGAALGVAALTGLIFFGGMAVRHWRDALIGGPGRFRRLKTALGSTLILIPVGAFAVPAGLLLNETLPPAALALMAAIALTGLLFVRLMRAPTEAGRRVMDAIEGFRLYLSIAEQPRLDALHPPEMTLELFEKYLPYAIALDVETAWGERFAASVGEVGPDDSAYRPLWYRDDRGRVLDGRSLAATVGGSLAGAIAASSTPPGSGGGGSGGGGSAGGGGGGGGGGGW